MYALCPGMLKTCERHGGGHAGGLRKPRKPRKHNRAPTSPHLLRPPTPASPKTEDNRWRSYNLVTGFIEQPATNTSSAFATSAQIKRNPQVLRPKETITNLRRRRLLSLGAPNLGAPHSNIALAMQTCRSVLHGALYYSLSVQVLMSHALEQTPALPTASVTMASADSRHLLQRTARVEIKSQRARLLQPRA